jgi:hypothetical protein
MIAGAPIGWTHSGITRHGRCGFPVASVPACKQTKWTLKYNRPGLAWGEYPTVKTFSLPTQIQRMSRSEKAEGTKMLGSNEIIREGERKEKKRH